MPATRPPAPNAEETLSFQEDFAQLRAAGYELTDEFLLGFCAASMLLSAYDAGRVLSPSDLRERIGWAHGDVIAIRDTEAPR